MSKPRILIVEDKRVTAEHLRSALTGMGYEAEWIASTGEEAVSQAMDLRPDLILMDIMLAGEMDGIEAAQTIRSSIGTPIVFLSAYSNEETVRRAASTEPFGYLLKPFRTEELKTTIETALFKHNMEKRLRQSEQRLQLALKGGALGTWDINVKTGEAIYDQRAAELFGYSLDELEPSLEAWHALIHPDDIESVQSNLKACLKGERPLLELEHRIRHSSGEWRWCLARGQVVEYDEEGKALRMMGTTMDVTDRKRAEMSLSKRVCELKALNEMAREVNRSLRFEEFIDNCRKQVMQLISPDLVVFYLREGDRLTYQEMGSETYKLAFEPPRHKVVGECLCGLVASHGKPEYCLNIHSDSRCTLEECKNAQIQSFAALPLLRENQVVGVLGIASLNERDFSQEALFLEALAAHISVGLHNACLHRDLERTAQDLTAEIERRKLTEQSLSEEHSFRKAVIERAAEGLCVCHETEDYPFVRFTVWNDRMTEITGYCLDAINELGWYQSMYPDLELQRKAVERMQRMRLGEDLHGEEWEVTRADGERRVLSISSSAMERCRGGSHVLALISDVTDRKRTEDELKSYRDDLEELVQKRTEELEGANEELRRAKAEWELTFDSVPELIAILGNDNRILRGNKALAERLGISGAELPGLLCYEAIHGSSSQPPDCPHALLMADGGSHSAELVIGHLGGVFDVTVAPLRDDVGKIFGSAHIVRDITERRAGEEARVQVERLGAIADLASGVAHHFNNMLQAILGGISVALMKLGRGETATAEPILQKAVESCRFGAETVRRLQEFVRIGQEEDNGDNVFDLNQIALQAIETTRKSWERRSEEQGIRVSLVKDLADGCFIRGNKGRFFAVISSLIKNALEAMPEGGELRIETSVSGDQVLLKVKDSGIGIPQEHLSSVFDPFFSTKGFQRFGMGLAESYGIVTRYGGTISAENNQDNGATFKVILPLATEPLTESLITETLPISVGLRILVIADMEPMRLMLSEFLNESGHEVIVTSSGEQGLRIFSGQTVDAIICDLEMPGIDCWTVGKQFKAISQKLGAVKPPLIVLTGWGDQIREEARLVECGIDAVIAKPLEPSRICTIVEDLARCRLVER